MKVRADFGNVCEIETDALVALVYEGEKAGEGVLKELDERSGGILQQVLGTDEMRGKAGDTVFIHQPGRIGARRLLLVGVGKREDFSLETLGRYAGTAARVLRSKGARSIAFVRRSDLNLAQSAQTVVEGVLTGLFEPDAYRTSNKEERRIEEVILAGVNSESEPAMARGIRRGQIIGEALNLARDLANEPSSTLTPSRLAEQAVESAAKYGLNIDVLDETRMKELGMGALLG